MQFVTTIDKAWARRLDPQGVEAVVSLGMYNRRAVLLYTHTDDWLRIVAKKSATEEEKQEVYWGFFYPYYSMWVSTLYVIYEGLRTHLKIDDPIIKNLVREIDVNVLRKYRNATFHFDEKFRSNAHSDYIGKNGFISTRRLFERENKLILRMVKLIKHNRHYNTGSV